MTRTFIASDLHLGHTNIIRYCDRPFASVREMDRTIFRNWNDLVDPDDTVYYLGDLTLRTKRFWDILNDLNGTKILVWGNHDPVFPDAPVLILKSFDDIPLMLIHNPRDVPDWYQGWVVHGHKHNTTPHCDPATHRVNVCVEHTDYCPMPIDEIITSIRAAECAGTS